MNEPVKIINTKRLAKISLLLVVSSFFIPFIGFGLSGIFNSSKIFFLGLILCAISYSLGVILGIAAIVIIKRSKEYLGGGDRAVHSIIWALIFIVLFFILVPGYHHWERRRGYAEADIKAIHALQISFMCRHRHFAKTFKELGWKPGPDKYYAYFLSTDEIIQPTHEGPFSLPDGIDVFVRDKSFQIVAVGNIDSDEELDILLINEKGKLKIINKDLGMWPWQN